MSRYRIDVGYFPDNTKSTLDLFLYTNNFGVYNNVPSELTLFNGGDVVYFASSNTFPEIASVLNYSLFSEFCNYFVAGHPSYSLSAEQIFNFISTGSNEALTFTPISSTQYKIESSTLRLKFDSDGFSSLNFSTENINTPDNGENNGGIVMARKISDVGMTFVNGTDGGTFLNVWDNMDLGESLPATTAELATLFAEKAAIINTLLAPAGAVTQQDIDDGPVKVAKMNFPVYTAARPEAAAVPVCKYVVIYNIEDPRDSTNMLKITATLNGVPDDVSRAEMEKRLRGTYNDTTKVYENGALPLLVGPSYKGFVWCRPTSIKNK